jgi:transposase-like protein
MKSKTTSRYENSFKRQVVLEVLSGSITKEEARRRYNIGGKSTILDWMRDFAGLKMKVAVGNPMPILQQMDISKDKTELEEKIKQLEAKLEYAELKGRAYQIMVEIAKEKYNLDLEKKSGAKQFKNSKKSDQK